MSNLRIGGDEWGDMRYDAMATHLAEADKEDSPCDDCELRAIDQNDYDVPLCEEHHQDALAWDEADRQVKAEKEDALP
jgi:hypothetical protein